MVDQGRRRECFEAVDSLSRRVANSARLAYEDCPLDAIEMVSEGAASAAEWQKLNPVIARRSGSRSLGYLALARLTEAFPKS